MAHKGYRRDGFTPAKKARAVEALETFGTIADAARVAGVSDTTFYRHLAKDAEFARLCELAQSKAARPIETLAWERATVGAEEVTIRNGVVVSVRRKPSDAMMRLLLQASNPKKYGRTGQSGATRRQIERKLRKAIEKEIRAEMAEREAAEAPDPEEVDARLARKFEALRRRMIADEGYTEGPCGTLIPPGWTMVPSGDAPGGVAGGGAGPETHPG